MTKPTPAGWYPDPEKYGQQRYWDGNDWTENFAPWTASPAAVAAKKPIYKRTWFIVVAVMIGLGAIGNLIDGFLLVVPESSPSTIDSIPQPPETEVEPAVAPSSAAEQEKIVVPEYSVLNEDVYDIPIKTQVILNLLVSGDISEPGLRTLLNQLYSSTITRKGFKYHDSPTNIYIYAFTSKERAESGMGQWIAMLQKNYSDLKPSININTRQIAQLGAKSEERFGLSEKTRKEIWKELIQIEDRARKEADEQYPLDPTQSLRVGQVFQLSKETPLMPELDPEDPVVALQKIRWLPPHVTIKVLRVASKQQRPWYFVEATRPAKVSLGSGWINSIALMGQVDQVDLEQQLKKHIELEKLLKDDYDDELVKKHGVTHEQLEEIALEGLQKEWPFPKSN